MVGINLSSLGDLVGVCVCGYYTASHVNHRLETECEMYGCIYVYIYIYIHRISVKSWTSS